jgi:hypothetical protein
VVGRPFGGAAVPVDAAADDDAAGQAPQLGVDVDERLARGDGSVGGGSTARVAGLRGRDSRDDRQDAGDDEQGDADGRRPGTAWVAGVDWP